MRPDKIHRRVKATPAVQTQAGLQGMVGRVGGGLFLVDIEQSRERCAGNVEVDAVGTVEPANKAVWCRLTPCGALAQIESGDLRLGRLVDVSEAEKLGPLCAHVADLNDGLRSKLLLDVQVEILGIGSTNVGVGPEKVTQRRESGEHR